MKELRKDCWNNALHTFGTAYIFRKKAEKYKRLISSLKFFGIAVPLTIGATASGYGLDSEILKWVIFAAAPLTILQLIVSLLALVRKWDDELSYSYESASEHSEISIQYENLAKYPPNVKSVFQDKIGKLETQQKSRDKQDDKHSIIEKEERMGMRYALRKYQRNCAACGETPTSMTPTSCNVCGKF